jgi:hypothetical protein
LALAAVYAGMRRADAAQVGGMDRQRLKDWAHRFNADGPEGLRDRPRGGRRRRVLVLGDCFLGRGLLGGFPVGCLFGQAESPQARHPFLTLLPGFFFFLQALVGLLLGCGELFLGP